MKENFRGTGPPLRHRDQTARRTRSGDLHTGKSTGA